MNDRINQQVLEIAVEIAKKEGKHEPNTIISLYHTLLNGLLDDKNKVQTN